MHSFFRTTFYALLACNLAAGTLHAAGLATPKYRVNLAPPAELSYAIKANQKGLRLEGNAVMRWSTADRKFSATNETRAMLVGKILDAKSEGVIDSYGLAPSSFVEKRLRKEATTTSFDRAARTIRFTGSERTYPINGGEQDRNSVIWQLVAVARAAPAKFKPGSSWTFFVAGQRDAEPWTFKVDKQEKLRTPLGELNALHIARVPAADSRDQRLDIWLAPQREWYPVRLRFSEDNGDFIEQTVEAIVSSPP